MLRTVVLWKHLIEETSPVSEVRSGQAAGSHVGEALSDCTDIHLSSTSKNDATHSGTQQGPPKAFGGGAGAGGGPAWLSDVNFPRRILFYWKQITNDLSFLKA